MVFLNKSLLNSSTARRHALTGKGERERRTAFLNLQSSSFSASFVHSLLCLFHFLRTSGMGSQDRGGEGGGEGRQVPSGG